MKILIIANACQWESWPQKSAAIKAFYAPLVEMDIDIVYTDFTNIPLGRYPGTVTEFGANGPTDVAGTDLEIDQTWFNDNIGPMIAGYDIAVFQAANVSADGLPLGVKFEEFSATWCCETFVTDENFTYALPELPGQTAGTNLGNEAEVIIEHELSHALYSISGQTDNTHKFFYADQFSRVLTDIVLPNQTALTTLFQKVIADLQEELGLLKTQTQQSSADTAPPAAQNAASGTSETPIAAQPSFPTKILAWSQIIGKEEGANPTLHNMGNLKYSALTASWGATKGPAAEDGGFLCQFETDQDGENALCRFLVLGCEDELVAFHAPAARTLSGFTVVYAGNPPQGYIDAIVSGMGVPADTQISTFLG